MRNLGLIGLLAVVISLFSSCGLRLPVQSQQFVASRPAATPSNCRDNPPDVLVWLTADSYHTGMIFPYDWLIESGFVPPREFGHPRYVVMSWGNRDAYSPEGINNPWKFFRVMFTPTDSVMELIPVNWDVAEVCPGQRIWRKLAKRDCGPALADFLNQCTAKDLHGRPVVTCPSSWGNGVQLESSHSYFIPRVCNVWTAQTIEALGGRINPWFALTADGLVRQAERSPNDFELIWPGGGKENHSDE